MAQKEGELIVEKREEAWLLGLRGEHDLSTRGTLQAEIEAVFAYGTKVVVDLSETCFLDSAVLKCLFDGFSRSQEHAADAFVVVCPTGTWARQVLDMVKLPSVIPVFEDVDRALASLAA
jgi:anti-anti-sigma factor